VWLDYEQAISKPYCLLVNSVVISVPIVNASMRSLHELPNLQTFMPSVWLL